MKILHLLSWFPTPDNPLNGNFCLKQIAAVSQYADSVALSVLVDSQLAAKRSFEWVEHPNFRHLYVHIRPATGLLARLRTKCRQFRAYQSGLRYVQRHIFTPDGVHLHVSLPLGLMALFWKLRYRLPYVLTEHWSVFSPANRSLMTCGMLRKIRMIARHASCILPVSVDLQRNMQRYGICGPFAVVPNVVDTDLFALRMPQERPKRHILHISNLRDDAKNFSGILRTIRKLATRRTDFVLDVVHDAQNPDFERFVRDNQLEDFVCFHGAKQEHEVAQCYANADFFLLFSNFENLPCVLIESFACGLPVVTTTVGGIGEIMDESRGLTVDAGDEDALCQVLATMLDQCHTYDAAAIRQYAVEHFSTTRVGEMIHQVYQKYFAKKS